MYWYFTKVENGIEVEMSKGCNRYGNGNFQDGECKETTEDGNPMRTCVCFGDLCNTENGAGINDQQQISMLILVAIAGSIFLHW